MGTLSDMAEQLKIRLNGEPVVLDGPLTVSGLLARHKLKPETVVVEHNLRVPPKPEYDRIVLADGDRVEIVKFMGGG
jgi:thiamine biosynthesis protein ThiS